MKRLLITFIFWIAVGGISAYGQLSPSKLSAKHLARAEKLVAKLEQFEAVTYTHPRYADYKALVQSLSTAVNKSITGLPESSVKTDFATAIYMYELVALNWHDLEASETSALNCAGEKPRAYQKLCQSVTGSRRDLLWSKARLHVRWAKAVILDQNGVRDERMAVVLSEVEAERRDDKALAERAMTALKLLESEVVIYQSRAAFEENGALARVPFETFKTDLKKVSAYVEAILLWLPQCRLRAEIRNALRAYLDGGFWWAKVQRPLVVNITQLDWPETSLILPDTPYLATIPYTVAINWRQASQHIERAEGMLDGTKRRSF